MEEHKTSKAMRPRCDVSSRDILVRIASGIFFLLRLSCFRSVILRLSHPGLSALPVQLPYE